jgi:hypothetical protein
MILTGLQVLIWIRQETKSEIQSYRRTVYTCSNHNSVTEACLKRRASHVPNALEAIDNEAFQLIIYCF